MSISGVVSLSFLFALLWVLKRRQKLVESAGENGFQNVILPINRRKNALRIAALTTLVMFLFFLCAFFVVMQVQPSPSASSVIIYFSLLLAAVFAGSFFYNAYSLGASINASFSGLGPGLEEAYGKNYLVLSDRGIEGAFSVPWRSIQTVTAVNTTTLFISFSRKPRWIWRLFGMDGVQVAFSTPEDKNRFQQQSSKYL